MIASPQQLAYDQWKSQLHLITRHKKLRDYGKDETPDSLWKKLPRVSKVYWQEYCGVL